MVEIASTCLGIIAEYLAAPVGRQFGYLLCFNANVGTLEEEAKKLSDVKVGIQMQVDEATMKGECIFPNVQTWLDDVGKIDIEAQKIIKDKAEFPKGCFNRWCLKFKSRHALSRTAKKKTQVIVELHKKGEAFQRVACPAPPKLVIRPTSSTINLVSRNSMLNDIIEHLKNEEISMIGICGMGGVGKTTMMQEVAEKVQKDSLFDDIGKTVVSQNRDLKKIQSDIAEHMGLELKENSLEVRAGRINTRLQGKKVLIILDDVWEGFDLQPLGIDLKGNKWCKILYTSRNKSLWMEFGSRRCELPLDVLPYGEAFGLFKEKVGDLLHKQPEFLPIAEQIVKECGRLPLSLVTLGSALGRKKSKHSWIDTLSKLKMASDPDKKVYECLKRSYDYLDNEEAKSLFLLCSLFKEDSKIHVERLVHIGMGLRLFKRVSNVEAARHRVFALLDHLHNCYLVSNPEASYIRVHDEVRTVSKSIAFKEKGALVFEDGDNLERVQEEGGKFENSRWISIISRDIEELPTWLNCPKLELLMCRHSELQLADSCFERMENLLVVDINCYRTRQFPPSLKFLKSLRTMRFKNCDWEDLSAIGNLERLEILLLSGDTGAVPEEIGQLTKLMVLDLSDCRWSRNISPGVISSLTNLEELYLPAGVLWEGEGNEEGTYPSLRELEALSNLHTLYITVKDPTALRNTFLFGNLKKYRICIGEPVYFSYSEGYEKALRMSLSIDIPLKREFQSLLYNSDAVHLRGSFAKDMALEFLREGSPIVKFLFIGEIGQGDAMDCTVAPSLLCTLEKLWLSGMHSIQHICTSPLVAGVFEKLKQLFISNCDALENIVEVSSSSACVEIISGGDTLGEEVTATTNKLIFPQLQELLLEELPKVVSFCEGIDEIQFPQLRSLWIKKLERIEYFGIGIGEIQFPQLTDLNISSLKRVECLISSSWSDEFSDRDENFITSFFPHKVSFPSLVRMWLFNLENMKKIWCGQLQSESLCNLAKLSLNECNSLQYVFSPWMARHLVHLQELTISKCKSLKAVVHAEKGDGEHTSSILPQLKKILLDELPTLGSFCHDAHNLEFLVLEDLNISNCPSGTVQHLLDNISFPSLVTIRLSNWENMNEIWYRQLQSRSFYNLVKLTLDGCNNLQYVFCPWMDRYLVHLKTLAIIKCKSLKAIVHAEKGDGEHTSNILTQLKKIRLNKLPTLESFCHVAHNLEFPMLEDLGISNCPNGIVQHLLEDVSFPSLVKMRLCNLENMKEIWCGQLQYGSFCNLVELTLKECNSLQYVFSPWMARYLVHLDTLIIVKCERLKEVVLAEKEGDGRGEYTSSILPELKNIVLNNLPAIEIFCHISHDLEFPVLNYVQIVKCPELKTLAPRFVRTPNLRCVYLLKEDWVLDKLWKGNLNDTIQHLYEDQQEQWRQQEEEQDGSEEEQDGSEEEQYDDMDSYNSVIAFIINR